MPVVTRDSERIEAIYKGIEDHIPPEDMRTELEKLRQSAYDKGQRDKLKEYLRVKLSNTLRLWITSYNWFVLILLTTIFLIGVCDVYSDTININQDIFSPSVLISLIGATVAQTTAGFLALNRWAFSDKKKGEPE